MMRTLNSFAASAALLLTTVGMLGCPDVTDPFDTLTTTLTTLGTAGDGDGDMTTETSGNTAGDGDGDGDGDGTPGDGDGAACGGFGDACTMDTDCCEGTVCGMDGTCGLPDPTTGDGDGAPADCTSEYDPAMCTPPAMILGVMDVMGGFCSCPCTVDADCPMGPQGTTAACALSTMGGNPEYCALICDPANDACPMGATCQPVPMQMGVGLCTYPVG